MISGLCASSAFWFVFNPRIGFFVLGVVGIDFGLGFLHL